MSSKNGKCCQDVKHEKHHHHHEGCGCHHEEHRHHHEGCGCHEEAHHYHHEGSGCHQEAHHPHEGCGCHNHEGCGCGCQHTHSHFPLLLLRALCSILLIIISTFLDGYFKNIVLIISYIIIAYDILYLSAKNIIKGKVFDENFLMSIASITALVVPFFTLEAHIDPYDGIFVIILYQIGEFIQHKAVDKSKKSITDMLDLDVRSVSVIKDLDVVETLVENINIGDIIIVKPGDKIVVDGIVVKGSSSLNTQSLTGESMPKDVYVNDTVLSGMINNDGLLHVKATTKFNDSTTSKVKEIVEKANHNKAKLDRFFTRFAKVYTPVVILISLFIMFVIPLILGFDKYFLTYLYKGLAVMVISCPCALVISIPLSYFMGIGKAAKNQILVKGASYLEVLTEIDTVLFDKTGTLTKGEFIVTKEYSTNKELMYSLLYSAEKNFSHAIAKSITNYLDDKATLINLVDLINIPGYGVKALYNGDEVLIGNAKLLKENKIEFTEECSESTIVYVSYGKSYLGYLIIEDEIKDDAITTLNYLIKNYEVQIISGDKEESVKKVADILNIDTYHYGLLPTEKVELLDEVIKDKKVVYVGDGINDAACLISSTVGMAMRSLGSDIAINASDIVLMDDRLESVVKAIKISKKTKKIVIQNIVFCLGVKTLVMLLALFLDVPMYIAIIADVGVALVAVLNSLRIMYSKI